MIEVAPEEGEQKELYQLCFFLFFYKFIYFIFGCVGSSLLHAGFLQLWRAGATLHCGAWASHCSGFSCCRACALGARAQKLWLVGSSPQVQQLWRMDLVAQRHVGSSWTRAQTHVPCIGRQILNHCATREALRLRFKQLLYDRSSLTLN